MFYQAEINAINSQQVMIQQLQCTYDNAHSVVITQIF